MPLSDALKARLAKRGLIEDKPQEFEEVIAEDYSHDTRFSKNSSEVLMRWMPRCPNRLNLFFFVINLIACLLRSNPYHKCSDYCEKRYGLVTFQGVSNPDVERKRLRMLRLYPLPDGWKEIADPETNRYYYCNLQSGQCSWLSPVHPKAKIYLSGERLSKRKHYRPSPSRRSRRHESDSKRQRSSDNYSRRRRSPSYDRD